MSERMFTTVLSTLYFEKLSVKTHVTSVTVTTEYTHARTHIFCQGNFLNYNRITSTKFPSFCMANLQHRSHKPYDPSNSVK